jgi:hypothetical protein
MLLQTDPPPLQLMDVVTRRLRSFPAIISQLLRNFDLRHLLDTLGVSCVGHALETIRTAIYTISDSLDVQVALTDSGHAAWPSSMRSAIYANRQRQ